MPLSSNSILHIAATRQDSLKWAAVIHAPHNNPMPMPKLPMPVGESGQAFKIIQSLINNRAQ